MRRPAKRLSECPNCGAEFDARRLACPECGSDAETGWKSQEDIDYEAVELPDALEVDDGPRPRTRPIWPIVAVVAAVLLIVAFVVQILLGY
jgi:hypothetical protein